MKFGVGVVWAVAAVEAVAAVAAAAAAEVLPEAVAVDRAPQAALAPVAAHVQAADGHRRVAPLQCRDRPVRPLVPAAEMLQAIVPAAEMLQAIVPAAAQDGNQWGNFPALVLVQQEERIDPVAARWPEIGPQLPDLAISHRTVPTFPKARAPAEGRTKVS